MLLTDFIEVNHEKIVSAWVEFARTLAPWSHALDDVGLRDHASELVTALVHDMKSSQSYAAGIEKSEGRSDDGALALIGEKHASDRLESGQNIKQLVSEFRALRATVLRLWEEEEGSQEKEVTRFNEAIDETLTKSVARYAETVEKTQEEFVGILSHDLRNPIGAILMGATLLSDTEDEEAADTARRIHSSAERMNRMVSELLDLTRSRLGTGIPVHPKPMNLEQTCRQIIDELQISHADAELVVNTSGVLTGTWDSDRLAQAISNLTSNALQYGAEGRPITISMRGETNSVVLEVHNEGPVIPSTILKKIFAPMTRHQALDGKPDNNSSGLGLGLHIASEIVNAHGGTIEATSDRNGTTFQVTLPRMHHLTSTSS